MKNRVEMWKQPLTCIWKRWPAQTGRGPPLPAQKVCLRCNAPCCQSHVQTHLQQPSSNPGHLLVEAEDVRAWSCPQHDAYRLYHCEAEQVAVCQYCCFSRCGANHGHSVCDVEVRRNDIRQMLMKQQDRVEEREQDIEDQIYKLESDKRLVEDKVQQLKEEVRLQYQKMQQLLEEDLGKTLEILDKARSKFCEENSSQALQLNERRQEAKKLLSSVQVVLDKTEDINFMKGGSNQVAWSPNETFNFNMASRFDHKVATTQTCTGSGLPPYKVGHLNSKLFLSEISKKEKNLRKMLEAPFSAPAHFLQSIPTYPCSLSSSGAEKRKHSTAFPENSNFLEPPSGAVESLTRLSPSVFLSAPFSAPAHFLQSIPTYPCSLSSSGAEKRKHSTAFPENSNFLEPPSGAVGKQYLGQGSPSGEGQSTQAMVPCSSTQHMVGLGSSGAQAVHSSSVFPPHYPSGGSSQQPVLSQYGAGRKILMCTVDNCYCSGVPSVSNHSGHPPYPRSSSFPWTVSSQEYSHPLPPAPGLSVRDWIDASQTHRHPDFYGLYGQSSTKHYVTS
ncbi:putative E3 ubiquitin-protein ligase TRIM8 [Acipenser ruthenus]|uniref:Putative E3 ubiquitin-protein ligase TRIM8 n=1 Tax=Acipenser ruthenus TaxID=7906 RepID=A0A662YTW2_ACIRT|nr:putative E3 ubiquitin-protein ligase TRIM8 [Acipenser ruthenus]